LLNDAAIEAVKQWRYKPQTLNGQAIEVITTITVNFTFQQ
jgi:protein TonB